MASLVHDPRTAAALILLDELAGISDPHTVFSFVQGEVIEAGSRGFSPLETLEHAASFRNEVLDELAALRKKHRIAILDDPAPLPTDGALP